MGRRFPCAGWPAALALVTVVALAPLGIAGRAGAVPGQVASLLVPAPVTGAVGYARIEGMIDRLRARYLERVLAEAKAAGLAALVVHIVTDGGEVYYAREMFQAVLEQAREGPRMIAFVDDRALSAGAMIAYAHEAIYVSPTASIGDIGVIFRKPDGEIAYAPEKIETVIRTLLTQAAEQRGWDRALLLKMIAHKQKLYRVTEPDGTVRFVIEDDFPDYLSRHPGIDRENEAQVIVYRGEDRLLTLTGVQALELGMASGEALEVADVYRALGIDPLTVVDLSPRFGEVAAWFLAGFGPVLAGLALLFILFELRTPGVGLWAALGALFGALFLMAHFALDLVNNLELVLILLGAALLFLELLTAFGGGLIGVAGGLTLLTGLLLGFLPDEIEFDWADERFRDALSDALLDGLYTVVTLTLGIVGFLFLAPRSRFARRMTLRAEVRGTSAGAGRGAGATLGAKRGVAREALHPSGTVVIEGETYTARAEHGTYVEAGRTVEVVGTEFGELVVREVEPGGQG